MIYILDRTPCDEKPRRGERRGYRGLWCRWALATTFFITLTMKDRSLLPRLGRPSCQLRQPSLSPVCLVPISRNGPKTRGARAGRPDLIFSRPVRMADIVEFQGRMRARQAEEQRLDLTGKMIPIMGSVIETFIVMGASLEHIVTILQATIRSMAHHADRNRGCA